VELSVVEYDRLGLRRVCECVCGTSDDTEEEQDANDEDSDGIIRGCATDDWLRIGGSNRSVRFNTLLSTDRFRHVFIIILTIYLIWSSVCLFGIYLICCHLQTLQST